MKIKRDGIDAAVAVEVMGYTPCSRGKRSIVKGNETRMFLPSTDLNHAFEALETLCSKRTVGYSVSTLFHESKDEREVCITSDTDDSLISMAEDQSLAIAICLALLSAVRGEQVEVSE